MSLYQLQKFLFELNRSFFRCESNVLGDPPSTRWLLCRFAR